MPNRAYLFIEFRCDNRWLNQANSPWGFAPGIADQWQGKPTLDLGEKLQERIVGPIGTYRGVV